MFKNKKSKSVDVGIYLMFDPDIPDSSVQFSPPFFSVNDNVACQALLETLRRHHTSCDQLYTSAFLRLDLWHVGAVDLSSGKVLSSHAYRYRVCNVGDYLNQDYVRRYMSSVSYPSQSDIEKGI